MDEDEPSLAPEWLCRDLPSSSQDSKTSRSSTERDKPSKRFGKQTSFHHTASSPHPLNYTSPSSSPNWRLSDTNPRILNRSKSSPVFDSKDQETPKSPRLEDRSNPSPSPERFPIIGRQSKSKIKKPPTLTSSISQPNFFSSEKLTAWQHQKLTSTRSPPTSRSNSYTSLIHATSPPPQGPIHGPSSMAAAIVANGGLAAPIADDIDLEMEKLRVLVPAASLVSVPKPPRLVGGRKSSHTKAMERPKKPVTPTAFRKAPSESSLGIPPGGASEEVMARKIRAVRAEKVNVSLLKETAEEKDKIVGPRSNFFMDVIKIQKQRIQGDAEEIDSGVGSLVEIVTEKEERLNSGDVNNKQDHHISTPPLTVEDEDREEKFLRLLGWLPEEEYHVEALKEDEISDFKSRFHR